MKHTQVQKQEKVVTRFAPSPTGLLHVGSARTALFNKLFARAHGGEMVLRIEDTDLERSKKEYEDNILEGLEWLGITYDSFARQSERGDRYREQLEKLIEEGTAYISKEETGESKEVIRLKNPGREVTFTDLIRGEITMDTTELGDFVIAKNLDRPLYHFAVTVDDADMEISHVIRGEDGISNTPRQILIQQALGAPRPVYAHIPLILAPDHSKLSKRHGAVSTTTYKEQGYLPEALTNFLAMLGWNPGTEQELFTKEELVNIFDIKKVQKGGAVFNQEKLDWYNREYLKKLPEDKVQERITKELSPYYDANVIQSRIADIADLLLERITVFSDIAQMAKSGEIDFYFKAPQYDAEELINPKERKNANEEGLPELIKNTITHLEEIMNYLKENTSKSSYKEKDVFSAEYVKELIWDYASEQGRGSVLWPMRFALSGEERSPDPFTLAEVLGRDETVMRLSYASDMLQKKL